MMMKLLQVVLFLVVAWAGITVAVDGATIPPEPVYQPPQVPHTTYPYVDNTYDMRYDGSNRQGAPVNTYYEPVYQNSIVPAAQGLLRFTMTVLANLGMLGVIGIILLISALQLALRVAAKVGLFLIGGVALLFVGGVFTTAVCSITPLCTITFHGISGLNKETVRNVRSLLTPENLSEASAFVHGAISKYNNLQKAVNGKQ